MEITVAELDPIANKEFFDLWEGGSRIGENLMKLNMEIATLKIPKKWNKKDILHVDQLSKRLNTLQYQFSEWYNKATSYVPRFKLLDSDFDKAEFTYLYYSYKLLQYVSEAKNNLSAIFASRAEILADIVLEQYSGLCFI